MRPPPIPANCFHANRDRLAGMLRPGSVAVAGSARPVKRNGDQNYPFRQDSGFFYLTGIDQPETVLVMKREEAGSGYDAMLFIRRPSPRSLIWEGPGLTPRQASDLSGVEEVRWIEELGSLLRELLKDASSIYHSGSSAGSTPEEILSRLPPSCGAGKPELFDLAPLTDRLRRVKSLEESECIRRASGITREAFLKVLRLIAPGTWEKEIEAEITGEFIRRGATGHAFEPIVASGRNALILHYVANSSRCREGELVLMDFGAEVNNYASDCTRTVPVSGRFTARQRQVYEAVLRIFRQAREWLVPGTMLNDFHNRVGLLSQEEHMKLGLYSAADLVDEPGKDPVWKQYFMHGTSHSIGLDVHDPFDKNEPIRPGMVFTCEPAVYIPEEGTGIRLENTILVTGEGPVDLMEDIPLEPDEIESLMRSNR